MPTFATNTTIVWSVLLFFCQTRTPCKSLTSGDTIWQVTLYSTRQGPGLYNALCFLL